MPRQLSHVFWIVLAAGVVFFTNLGGPRLWDRDEPRNAGCAVEMLQRGDWIVPVFNDQLRTHKPVLLYWFMMTAYAVFGVNEFAARFWSALLAVGTVLMTYQIGRRLFSAPVGLWSAIALSSCLMFDVAARAATPDSVLIFFTTLATLVYVLGTFKPKEEGGTLAATEPDGEHPTFPISRGVAVLMYAAMGIAVLAKGPVGLVLPVAVIGMFLLIVRLPAQSAATPEAGWRRWSRVAVAVLRPFAPLHFLRTCWSMRPLTALIASLAVALPWYVWVGVRTDGEWIKGFLLTHNLGRTLQPMEGHGGSVLYYPLALLIGFFPWSLLLAPALIGLFRRVRRGDPWAAGYLLAACWGGVYLAVFSIARTKLPSYITPAYPAFALITACYVHHWTQETALSARIWPRLGLALLGAAGGVMLIGLPLAAHRYLPGEEWLGAVGLIPLIGAIASYVLLGRGRRFAAAATFAATALALVTAMFGFVALRVDRHQKSDVLLGAISARSSSPRIASFGVLEPSWVFYAQRPIKEISAVKPAEAGAFLRATPQGFLITTGGRYEQLKPELPDGVSVLATAPYFLRDDQLMVVGSVAGSRPSASAARVARRAPSGRSGRR